MPRIKNQCTTFLMCFAFVCLMLLLLLFVVVTYSFYILVMTLFRYDLGMPHCLKYQQYVVAYSALEFVLVICLSIRLRFDMKVIRLVILLFEVPIAVYLALLILTKVSILSQEWRHSLIGIDSQTNCEVGGIKLIQIPYYCISVTRLYLVHVNILWNFWSYLKRTQNILRFINRD